MNRDRRSIKTGVMSTNNSIASSVFACHQLDTTKKSVTFTDKALDPYNDVLRCRLDNTLYHLPVINTK